jgi:hypothetical protein
MRDMSGRGFGMKQIKKLDKSKLAGSLNSDKPIIIKSVEDLPPVSKKLQAAYDANKQNAAFMAMLNQETVRVWYCHNCRRIINLSECEQSDLPPDTELIDCPRCEVSKAELMGEFNPGLG